MAAAAVSSFSSSCSAPLCHLLNKPRNHFSQLHRTHLSSKSPFTRPHGGRTTESSSDEYRAHSRACDSCNSNDALIGHTSSSEGFHACKKLYFSLRRRSTKIQASGSLVASQDEAEENSRWVFGAGIRKDLERRLPYYVSDFADGLHPKAVASVFFLYFACLAPCIAFGGLLSHVTAGHIGVVETITGAAGVGVLYPLAAGQPLTLLGPTGLMVVFCGLLYKVAVRMGLPFLPIYGWVGIWSCLFLIILAAIEASDLICHFTRFTDETFSALISLGYISEASKSIGNMFKQSSPYTIASSLLAVILASGTWRLATFLTQLKSSRFLVRSVRNVLSDFGPPLAIFLMSCTPHLLFPSVPLPELLIPSTFSTTSGRSWQVPLWSIPLWAIGASTIPAVLLTLLVFLDQNITTRLVNNPEYHLTKGAGYHLDLAVLGVLMAICSCFGLPWMFASTVPSLSHVRSLATTSKSIHISGDNAEAPDENVVGVRENRLTGILIHVCVGASLLLLSLLRLVPMPVIDGIFMYMGITSLTGNQFIERLKLWFCDPELYPQHEFIQTVPIAVLHSFTALQLACVAALWALKHSPYGITFPLLILALMPVRNYIAGKFVAPQYLDVMDAH
ncbi:hypothetical protein L7F22_057391 [Adiantum nelumboides]|nr:hypothetical protein [Adiantum nelumboides]